MYLLMRFLSLSVALCSPQLLQALARLASIVTFEWFGLRRKVILKNLDIAFGAVMDARARRKIGRASVYHFWQTILETLASVRQPIARDIDVVGAENMEKVLARGGGAYILCFHLGNWEAMGAKFTERFCPSYVIVKKIGQVGLNRWLEESRRHYGFHWIRRDRRGDGFKGIQDVLARGEIVGFAFDQTRPGEPRLPFFGQSAKTNTSLAAIWRRYPAPIVPAYIVRKGFGRHTLYIEPELTLDKTEDASGDILRHSQIFNETLEAIIRRHPEQYFWMHNRWKV